MTPLSVIEKIANNKDLSQAIIFFLFFSRFEYALKRTHCVRLKNGHIEADWDMYANKPSTLLRDDGKNEEFAKAVALIKNTPPKKQIISDEKLDWASDKDDQKFTLQRLFTLVRRIRNNLFHGGKFPEGPEEDVSRDVKLIVSGIKVLSTCLDFDSELRSAFMEGVE